MSTDRLYGGLSAIWENDALDPPTLLDIHDALALQEIELVSHDSGLSPFLDSRRSAYQHDAAQYKRYFAPDASLDWSYPSIESPTGSTAPLAGAMFQWAQQPGLEGGAALGRYPLIVAEVQQALTRREGQAITFSYFAQAMGDFARVPYVESTVRRRISWSFSENYIGLLSGTVATGMSELAYFEGLSTSFPFHDLRLLLELAGIAGLAPLIDPLVTGNDRWLVYMRLRDSLVLSELTVMGKWLLAGLALDVTQGARSSDLLDNVSVRDAIRAELRRLIPSGRRLTPIEPGASIEGALNRARVHLESEVIRLMGRSTSLSECLERVRPMESRVKADVLLMTVNDAETAAVRDALEGIGGIPTLHRGKTNMYWIYSPLGGVVVASVRSSPGAGSVDGSSLTLYDALRDLKPRIVIGVGVAFGRDEAKQPVGRVLVSSTLSSYDLARVGEGTDLPRGPARLSSSPMLLGRFRDSDWRDVGLDIECGELLSGSKLIDSAVFKAKLFEIYPEAIGGEMEGSGIYAASERFSEAKVDWILVKAICDYAENKSTDKKARQALAAANAARAVVTVLASGGFALVSG